MAPEIA